MRGDHPPRSEKALSDLGGRIQVMTVNKIISKSEAETMRLGERLASHLQPGDIALLFGDLGSGKTTLVKGIAKGLRINPRP